MPSSKSAAPVSDLAALTAKGWSLRAAADRLGVHNTHLLRVLNGERTSEKLRARAAALPRRHTKPKAP